MDTTFMDTQTLPQLFVLGLALMLLSLADRRS